MDLNMSIMVYYVHESYIFLQYVLLEHMLPLIAEGVHLAQIEV